MKTNATDLPATHNKERTMQTKPPPMTPARVVATGKQFGQKIGAKEAKAISALLIGWRKGA